MQFFLTKLQKMSLTKQFVVVIAVILCIPAISICVYYNTTHRQSLVTQCRFALQADLSQMTALMNSSLDKAESALTDLFYQQEFPYFLNQNSRLSTQEASYFSSKLSTGLTAIHNLYPNQFNGFYIFSSNHQIPESMDYYTTFTYMEQLQRSDYATEVLSSADNMTYGNIRYADSNYTHSRSQIKAINNTTLVLPLYRKIYDLKSRAVIGVLEVDTALSKLIPVNQLPVSQNNALFFLYHQESEQLYTISGSTSDYHLEADFSEKANFTTGMLNQKPAYLYYEPCTRTGLIRVVIQRQEDVFSSSRYMLTYMLLFVLVAFVLISVLAYHAVQILLKRLFEMNHMIRKIEQGDFRIHMEETGSDEIARIARSFNQMASKLQDTIDTLVAKDKLQKETELRALEAQINPHFLYNTLENMRMQCEIDEYYLVGDALAALGDLFRYSIKWTDNMVPLALEWKHLNHYLSIMQMRYGSKLICHMDYDNTRKDIDDFLVPKLIFQPLVENCFHHGFENRIPPYYIWIRVERLYEELLIQIKDNGCGITKKRLAEIKNTFKNGAPPPKTGSRPSIGIHNVRERIVHTCPKGSVLMVDSTEQEGTTITIYIKEPKEERHVSDISR